MEPKALLSRALDALAGTYDITPDAQVLSRSVDALAQLLAEREKLNGEGFKAFMEGKSLPEAADETASN